MGIGGRGGIVGEGGCGLKGMRGSCGEGMMKHWFSGEE